MKYLACAALLLPLFSACTPDTPPGAANGSDNANRANAAPEQSAAMAMPAAAPAAYDPTAVTGMAKVEDKAFFLTTAKWASNVIPVCWNSAAELNSPEAGWVRQAVTQTWQAASALRFSWSSVACATNARGIRITVEDSGPHTKGLGKEIDANPNGMVLNKTFRNWSQPCAASEALRKECIMSIAVHEFGHAIGFAHEQNSPAAPGECRKLAQGSNGNVMLTPWDIHSVMNYCNPEYNNNGQLSELDKRAVAGVYK